MKLTITAEATHSIHAEGLSPTDQIAQLLAAIGYGRAMPARSELVQDTAPFVAPGPSVSSDTSDIKADAPAASVLDEPSVQAVLKRERGKPSPGKKRRTAEEVAEDEAAEQTTAETAEIVHEAVEYTAPETPAISTGEARVGPEDEPEEDQIQDIADEHAEVAANTPADSPATLDDVRSVMGAYMQAYGAPAVQQDGQKIVTDILGPVPAGVLDTQGNQATAWAMSKFPEDKYPQIVAAFKAAIEANPFGRARV